MFPVLFFAAASLVNDVRSLIALHDIAAADRIVRASQARSGTTPEVAAAMSWLARAELDTGRFDQADSYAQETRKLSDQLLKARKLDAEPLLPIAVGASIEVHAQSLAARGERPEALAYLRRQLGLFGATSLHERIQKNINLLDLEGKPAPPLEGITLPHGRPVLLFFWAHWCSDCKAEAAILANVARAYDLTVLAPTRLYGYVAQGAEASPDVEKRYIEQVWQRFYSPALGNLPTPVSSANFLRYGSSSTPTLVLIDSAGIVRLFHPGAITQSEFAARVQSVLKR